MPTGSTWSDRSILESAGSFRFVSSSAGPNHRSDSSSISFTVKGRIPALYYIMSGKAVRLRLNSIRRYTYIIAGSVFFAVGFAGVFIPLLPTTPFLLLAAFFYLRSSTRMYHWLLRNRVVGAHIYSYITVKAIPLKTKIGSAILLWMTLIISMLLISSLSVRIFLVVVGFGVSAHLLCLKTLSDKEMKALHDAYRSQHKNGPDRPDTSETERFED